ncbi:hypothetical protein [Siphonobacter sp.]|uniref:hypothetical protein n=1 Tax=Siphonobacter sp. TaxID=1869184 RepID=UPI003B3B566A
MSTAARIATPVASIEVPVQALTKEYMLSEFGSGREPIPHVNPLIRSQLELAYGFFTLNIKNKATRNGDTVMIEIELPKDLKPNQFDSLHLYKLGKAFDTIRDHSITKELNMGSVLTNPGTAARIVMDQYDFDPKHEGKIRQQSYRQATLSRLKRGELLSKKKQK